MTFTWNNHSFTPFFFIYIYINIKWNLFYIIFSWSIILILIPLEKKRPKSLSLLITIEDELWLLITIVRWSLMFPNRIMQNYSKATFIWQKENKLCIIKTTAHKLLGCICSSLSGQLWWKWSLGLSLSKKREHEKKKEQSCHFC